jgi:D-alanine-D-alanine ligase
MPPASKRPRVLIAYNAPVPGGGLSDVDHIANDAVLDEAEAVFAAAKKMGYLSHMLPVSDLESVTRGVSDFAPDVVFNLCEGFGGVAQHEMHMAGLWELMHLPYTGNPALTLGTSQDKALCKQLFESNKIPTPPYQVYREIPVSTFLEFPVIAKPAREDASLGVTQQSVANDLDTLREIVQKLLEKYRQPILVEKYIPGREFNVSILDNPYPGMMAVGEIDFSQVPEGYHAITSYEAKWLTDHPLYERTPAVYPAPIDADLKQRLADVALAVYELLGGRDYGRVDTRVDSEGRIHVLEFNPNPDISADAGYAKALKSAGIAYERFIEILIENALRRSENGQHPRNSADRS